MSSAILNAWLYLLDQFRIDAWSEAFCVFLVENDFLFSYFLFPFCLIFEKGAQPQLVKFYYFFFLFDIHILTTTRKTLKHNNFY